MKNKIHQIDGKFYEECKIVTLAVNKEPVKGNLLLRHIWKDNKNLNCKSFWQYDETITIDNVVQYTTLNGNFRDCVSSCVIQHLYILSDDEIKESDWYFTTLDNEIHQASLNTITIMNGANLNPKTTYKNTHFKIIATTDDVLKIGINSGKRQDEVLISLPRPSNEFIKAFVNANGVGFDNVLVEVKKESYQKRFVKPRNIQASIESWSYRYNIKVALDNTVTIKSIKEDTWKEVFEILNNPEVSMGTKEAMIKERFNSPIKK